MTAFALHAAVEPPASAHREWWETRWFAQYTTLEQGDSGVLPEPTGAMPGSPRDSPGTR